MLKNIYIAKYPVRSIKAGKNNERIWIRSQMRSRCFQLPTFYIYYPPLYASCALIVATISCGHESPPPICNRLQIHFPFSYMNSILPYPLCLQADRKVSATAWRLRSIVKKTGREYIQGVFFVTKAPPKDLSMENLCFVNLCQSKSSRRNIVFSDKLIL